MFRMHTKLAKRIGLVVTTLIVLFAVQSCGGGSGSYDYEAPVNPQNAPNNDASGEAWSNPATWGGSVPAAGERVTIPAGKRVLIDTDINVSGLLIEGDLICANRDLNVTANWIMVHGLLQCGTESSPFQNRLDITLTGNNPAESIMSMGTKMIGAMNGGIISLHGEDRTSWLMLDETANQGDKNLQLEYAPNWRSGDIIVVTSTDDNMHHAEVRQISSINGKTVRFDKALNYRHFGEVQVYANQRKTWTMDTRAEVGLLTRNIRISGDDSSEEAGFGGHMMIMEGAAGFIAGVELYRMGQKGMLARYPFHWHLANDVSGQYFRNSSITRSFNRCVTVHGTHNASVKDNVCMDHIGHGYFLEDGGETNNTFDHNLGLITRKPEQEFALTTSDTLEGEAASGPSTFWISNGDNTFTNNAAAGSDGLGFWYDTPDSVGGASAGLGRYKGVKPVFSPMREFSNNRVHSSQMSFSSCSRSSGPIGYQPSNLANYQSLTVFSGGDGAVWPCHGNQRFTNLMVSDTGHSHHAGFVAPRPVTVTDSLFVANSKLSEGGRGRQRTAFGIYDFGINIRDTHFVNFDNQYGPSYLFGAREADVRITSNPVSGLTLQNSQFLYDRRKQWFELRPSQWGALIHDEDGSLGLGAGTSLVADHPMMNDTTCTDLVGTGRLCGNRFGRVEIDVGQRNLPPMTRYRSDGVEVTAGPLPERAHYQSVVAVNQNRYFYSYRITPEIMGRTNRIDVKLDFLHTGDTVVLEFLDLPPGATVGTGGWSAAANLNDLIFGAGNRFLAQGTSVFVKMKTIGTAWEATDFVRIFW